MKEIPVNVKTLIMCSMLAFISGLVIAGGIGYNRYIQRHRQLAGRIGELEQDFTARYTEVAGELGRANEALERERADNSRLTALTASNATIATGIKSRLDTNVSTISQLRSLLDSLKSEVQKIMDNNRNSGSGGGW
jgi:chromosome segregation ATPase